MHAKKTAISITHIKNKARRKTSSVLIETIREARKQKNWLPIAHKLSGATRTFSSVNLNEIDKQAKTGDTFLVLGKVLSSGNLTKRIRICALGMSASAKEKLKATKSEFASILDEINKNPKCEGLKVLQ